MGADTQEIARGREAVERLGLEIGALEAILRRFALIVAKRENGTSTIVLSGQPADAIYRGELTGRKVEEIVPAEWRERHLAAVRSGERRPDYRDCWHDFRMLCADGVERAIRLKIPSSPEPERHVVALIEEPE